MKLHKKAALLSLNSGYQVPKTCKNFIALCTGSPGYGYLRTTFHRWPKLRSKSFTWKITVKPRLLAKLILAPNWNTENQNLSLPFLFQDNPKLYDTRWRPRQPKRDCKVSLKIECNPCFAQQASIISFCVFILLSRTSTLRLLTRFPVIQVSLAADSSKMRTSF